MGPNTYERHPELVSALADFGPVAVDPAVPEGDVRLSVDVKAEHALRLQKAIQRERAAIANEKRRWDWRSGKPNPQLSGPPED
jgi:hypothetical protein